MTAETERKQWDPALVSRIQQILDKSAATASPVVGNTFARDDWRLSAEEFLERWNATRMCTVASASPQGHPHLAVIHAAFQDDGRLTMRMFEGSVRQRDFQQNPRVVVGKHTEDGTVMTVYGRPREVPGTSMPGRGGSGPNTVEVEIEISRIYAMKPRRD